MGRAKRRQGDPKVAVAYLRASTDLQDLGPEAQRASVAAWARREGVRVIAWHEDRVSGAAPLEERPGLLAAIDDLGSGGAGALVVARRDRLARDVVVAAMIERLTERNGARVLTADGAGNGDGPEAQLLRGIMDLFAQYERSLIRARTRAALAAKRARGESTGSAPYGFRLADDRVHLIEDVAEKRVVALVSRLRGQGLSLRAIARRLEAEGIEPRGGGRWHPQSVSSIVARSSGAVAASQLLEDRSTRAA